MGDVKPWEPVKGWYVPVRRDPVSFESNRWWGFVPDHFGVIASSLVLADGGSCRVTLSNNQKIIVRALSKERKAARRARQEAPK